MLRGSRSSEGLIESCNFDSVLHSSNNHLPNSIYQIQYELSCILSCDELGRQLNSEIEFVYNPLSYAKDSHFNFLKTYINSSKKLIFLGMNPGPWGMMQTGIPFGEVNVVRDWLKLYGNIDAPRNQHPSRPVLGFNCTRSEVSGRRFWALAKNISQNDPALFFKNSFVYNYYPLGLLTKTGKNITPSDLKDFKREAIEDEMRLMKDLDSLYVISSLNGINKEDIMEASPTICSFFGSELDAEDIDYLQQAFNSLFSGAKNKFTLSYNLKSETAIKSSSDIFSNPSPWPCNGMYVGEENCGVPLRKHGLKTSFGSMSVNQCFDGKTLFNNILKEGLDKEDIDFIKRSFHVLLLDNNESYWMSKTTWVDHTPTSNFAFNAVESEENLPLNKTGSARTEGYSKIDKLLLIKKRVLLKSNTSISTDLTKAPYSKRYRGNKQNMSRDARNDQRRLSTAYQTITHSNLLNLNELKFRKKKLKLGKSEIHSLGVFACEPISPNEIIIEYVGQIIRHIIADMREKTYKTRGIGSYCFRIDDELIIDATKYGSLNRYINHSCSPNSYAKILVINNEKKIVIYAKKSISIGEEITYDYKMPYEEDDKILCLCNTPSCRKSLN